MDSSKEFWKDSPANKKGYKYKKGETLK